MERSNMAAKGSRNINQGAIEKVVNRWLVDYYFSLAVEFFRNHQRDDFCAIRELLDALLRRPLESVDGFPIKIRLLQFLSRIYEGEKLDMEFDPDGSKSPLELALNLLESLRTCVQVPQKDFDHATTLVKEMIIGLFIKNKRFDKAKEALHLYFPVPDNNKRIAFKSLICQKSNTHEVIDQISFPQFKEEILDFCLKLFPFNVPFLHKAAKSLLEQRSDVVVEPSPCSSPQISYIQPRSRKCQFIQKIRLEVAYKALAEDSEETFSDLEEEVEVEAQERTCVSLQPPVDPRRDADQRSEQKEQTERNSCSPMEADQPPQTDAAQQAQTGSLSKTSYTVARLVVEPDSLPSSQCTTAPEELETKTWTELPPQTPAPSHTELTDLQCPITDKEVVLPTRTQPRRSSKTVGRVLASFAETSSDSEDSLPPTNGSTELDDELQDQSNKSLSKNSIKSRASSEEAFEQQERSNLSKTPMKRASKKTSRRSPQHEPSSVEDICVSDPSLDSSPSVSSHRPVPQKSSTPHKEAQSEAGHDPEGTSPASTSKRKSLRVEQAKDATEEKEMWIDEDSFFPTHHKRGSNESSLSNPGHRKRRWTEAESEKLKEGVKKYGEGNWSKIRSFYRFNDRSNVNLKDRWRTMKKLKLV
ncbi:telomeric repeat binding factor a isoform X2 [Fundulus heteroclitus]|uniref:telomeric repeat binding factor a isoform X2 n=1 Tax=Fundulus heteroclitus TaxID=8078 RepID=UPI00165BEED8|nr:telomeric repeat binding factor a isoform X2 [Fundulus heteroclitus]